MAKRRKKVRSLIAKEAIDPKAKKSLQLSVFIGCLVLSGLFVAIYYSQISTAMIWSDFLTTYRNQYNLIVHGDKDYCSPNIDTGKLFSKIKDKVINQEIALSSIELQLRNGSTFTAIGVVGTSGIGKSLFAQELKANFPWKENTNIFSWSSYSGAEDQKQEIRSFDRYLSECGRNLIIIDNLEPKNVDFIQEYNRLLFEYVQQKVSINLAVFYVFNVITYTDEQKKLYSSKLQSLEKLENVRIVEFRNFDSNDLKDCIRNEVRNLNLTLDDEDFGEVFKSIDTNRSGCKNVYSKVLMYGKRKKS